MSRVGKAPITLPSGVSVDIDGQKVKVKGPKGELLREFHERVSITEEDGVLTVSRSDDDRQSRALHGLRRELLAHMVIGVSEGFSRELEVIGVGYRASVSGDVLELALGYSHPIFFVPPEGVTIEVDTQRGKNTVIVVKGIDKQVVGQVAAKIRSLRPPEPYKGKGVRYVGEYVRRKAGKTAAR